MKSLKYRLLTLIVLFSTLWISCAKTDLIDESWKNSIVAFNTAGKDTIKTASGLKYIIIRKGTGPKADNGLLITAHFSEFLNDTVVYFSTYRDNAAMTFQLGTYTYLKGWEEGFSYFNEGDKVRLIIPPDLAYGDIAYSGIPANSTLTFDIEITKIATDAKLKAEKDSITKYVVIKDITEKPLASGLYYIPVVEGTGVVAEPGKSASVKYTASYFISGKVFDTNIETVARANNIYNSANSYAPLSFTVMRDNLIKGFQYGVSLMRKGGKAKLIIPSYLAYGNTDYGPILAYTTLVFDIELVDVQ